jgi:hypothetical protein
MNCNSENILTCKICGYKSKQLHQHLKLTHSISSAEYRTMFGADETRLKQRLSTISYLESLHGQLAPRYNKSSISIIEQYGKEHGYNFQHAENGGEYHIGELGYWVDGYDKEKNVVIEIDESYHFQNDGSLTKRDIQRQSEIEKHLNCKFVRIRYENK